jgi:dCMP deaminase
MEIAHVAAKRATCARRRVGCVIVDANGYILSTGYNGMPKGFPHCIDEPCDGANYPSGTGLDLCQSLHAEQNAIARLREPFLAHTLYCTTAPCISCVKLILATSMQRIVFDSDYLSGGKDLWLRANKVWDKL